MSQDKKNNYRKIKLQEEIRSSGRKDLFVNVILPFPIYKLFTYRVPQEMNSAVETGKRVVVQFGTKKIYTALIAEIHNEKPREYQAKFLLNVLDEQPVLYPLQLKFWKWIAGYYCAPVGDVMSTALPSNMKLESETRILLDETWETDEEELNDNEYIVKEALEQEKELTLSLLEEILNQKTIFPVIKSLYRKGVIRLKEELRESYKPKKETYLELDPGYREEKAMETLYSRLEKAPKQLKLLMAFQALKQEKKNLTRKEVLEKAGIKPNILRSLEKKGIFHRIERATDRVAWEEPVKVDFTLNEEQKQALNDIKAFFREKQVALLHGVTSSGKTHIYMKLIEETIATGRQCLYLVPEISLTTQLIRRLRSYFGNDIGIYHSRFNPNERVEIWYKVLSGEYKIVLGVRSALFLPFRDLGLVVVDEEHETTFKQTDPAPRYHARDAAIYLAQLTGGKVLLGTSTPSLESYYNAKSGKYGLVELNQRYRKVKMPGMSIIDLREEYVKNKMRSHFSSVLYDRLEKMLQNDEQAILFQNRRGYAPFLQCQVCGWVPECENCDISLTYHKYFKDVRCHYCGYNRKVPNRCAACGSPDVKMKSFGTEKIEDELHAYFPEIGILRLDQDTTRKKHAFDKLISAFESGKAKIMVGTQMITKGLDFEKVRLVAILNADQMLRFPDFRANERSFQLIQQVSGRAGRREDRGSVVIQTFTPEHSIFGYLLKNDYQGFYHTEIKERKTYRYPPYYRIVRLVLRDKKKEKLQQGARLLVNRLQRHFSQRVLGPEFPPVARIRQYYINHILLKFEKQNFPLSRAKHTMMEEIARFQQEPEYKSLRVTVDVDPY